MLGKIVARSLLELDLGRPQLVIKPLTKERLETAILGQILARSFWSWILAFG